MLSGLLSVWRCQADFTKLALQSLRESWEPGQNKPLQHFADFVSHDQWGMDHFGFKIVGDFAGFCAAVKEKGDQFSVEPHEFVPGGARIAFLKGPDGETIEIVERK